MHVNQHVANALGPLDDARQGEWPVVLRLQNLQEILASNVLQDQVGGFPVLNEVVDARHDRHGLESPQDLSLAAKEVQPDVELLRVGADHVLDGYRPIGLLKICW